MAATMDQPGGTLQAPPFDPVFYREHIPEIERRIELLKPHVIVVGLGPSAWLLRDVKPELLAGVRLWGVNDVCKILPVHDITIMDYNIRELDPRGPRYKTVVESRPERWWIYERCVHCWTDKLKGPIRPFKLNVWHPKKRKTPMLQSDPHNHTISSPVGTTSIAWSEGCRRIGIIGVDLLDGQHRLSHYHEWLDFFLGSFRKQARSLGGEIISLSPFARTPHLQPEAGWNPLSSSESSSAATSSSGPQELKAS